MTGRPVTLGPDLGLDEPDDLVEACAGLTDGATQRAHRIEQPIDGRDPGCSGISIAGPASGDRELSERPGTRPRQTDGEEHAVGLDDDVPALAKDRRGLLVALLEREELDAWRVGLAGRAVGG